MEDSFRVRVDKAFGSLTTSSPSPSSNTSLRSLWCLTDEEIERREWNREKDCPDDDTQHKPYPPNLSPKIQPRQPREQLQTDLKDLDDDDDDEEEEEEEEEKLRHRGSTSRQLVRPDDHGDEEWEIRSSIGLDCTLDYEEEEDEYDKVAVSREKAKDRLYMKDINGYWTDINFYDELPNTFEDVTRDPRANHLAAKLRLKEDAEAAGKFDTLRVSDSGSNLSNIETNTAEDGLTLKSILKRKENEGDTKSQKRVRFDPECKNYWDEEFEEAEDIVTDSCSMEEAKISEASFPPLDCFRVPDYILNPSKYTHYTFDSSSDIDEESNQKACMDFLHQRKRSNSADPQPVTSTSLPKSITFTPKKKLVDDASMVKNSDGFERNHEDSGKESVLGKGCPIGIAAAEAQESAIYAMEEDEPEKASTKNSSLQRQSRQYRTKANRGLDEPST